MGIIKLVEEEGVIRYENFPTVKGTLGLQQR